MMTTHDHVRRARELAIFMLSDSVLAGPSVLELADLTLVLCSIVEELEKKTQNERRTD